MGANAIQRKLLAAIHDAEGTIHEPNVNFSTITNVYPEGSWVQLAETSNNQAESYYEVAYPGNYTFDYLIDLQLTGGWTSPNGYLKLKIEGQLLQFITLDTITNLQSGIYIPFSGTTPLVSLQPLSKVSLVLERDDLTSNPSVYCVAGFSPSIGSDRIVTGKQIGRAHV